MNRHVPALDGVRGVAILLVLLCHLTVPFHGPGPLAVLWTVLAFGWVGVDLFFVLSGYLITGILLDTRRAPGAFRAFYARRALRIWPLYVLALVVMSAVAWGWPAVNPTEAAQFRAWAPWAWTHTMNLQIIASNTGVAAGGFGARGFWSLAQEEQFYLVWPLLALGRSPRFVARLALAAWGLSIAARVALAASHVAGSVIYVVPFARLDGLAAGAWLAAAARVPELRAATTRATARLAERPIWVVLAYLGMLVTVVAVLPRTRSDLLAQAAANVVLAVPMLAVLAAVVLHSRASLARLADARWLRRAGVVSYGLYVWHLLVPPIVQGLARMVALDARVAQLVAAAAVVAVASASWVAWERPWLSLKRRVPSAAKIASHAGGHAQPTPSAPATTTL